MLSGHRAVAARAGTGTSQVGHDDGTDDVPEGISVVDSGVEVVVVVKISGGMEEEESVTVVLNTVDVACGDTNVEEGQSWPGLRTRLTVSIPTWLASGPEQLTTIVKFAEAISDTPSKLTGNCCESVICPVNYKVSNSFAKPTEQVPPAEIVKYRFEVSK